MRILRKLCAAVLAVMMIAMPAMASVSVVTNSSAAVYRSASSDSESITVPKGLEMKLTGYENGWGKVSYKGRTGYIRAKNLNLKSPVAAYISKETTFYRNPGSNALGKLSTGTKVYFVGFEGDYARVTNGSSDSAGYVSMNALTTKKNSSSLLATESSARSSKIERVIYTAQNLMGRPYELAADPPNSFNCAAFVYYCFNKASSGKVGSTLSEQVHDSRYAKITSIAALKRGDIVCFNIASDSDPFGHVGIYIGGGWFVHASTSANKVTVNKLTSGYYRNSFSWGRRVFNS